QYASNERERKAEAAHPMQTPGDRLALRGIALVIGLLLVHDLAQPREVALRLVRPDLARPPCLAEPPLEVALRPSAALVATVRVALGEALHDLGLEGIQQLGVAE